MPTTEFYVIVGIHTLAVWHWHYIVHVYSTCMLLYIVLLQGHVVIDLAHIWISWYLPCTCRWNKESRILKPSYSLCLISLGLLAGKLVSLVYAGHEHNLMIRNHVLVRKVWDSECIAVNFNWVLASVAPIPASVSVSVQIFNILVLYRYTSIHYRY